MPKRKYKEAKKHEERTNDKDVEQEEETVEEIDAGATINEQEVAITTESTQKRPRRKRGSLLIICSKGITHRYRILSKDLLSMLPNAKKDVKLDSSEARRQSILEICELRSCDKCMYFECKKSQDLFLWMFMAPYGPTIQFLVLNVHTIGELDLLGNCLKGSRAVLSFDKNFETSVRNRIVKNVLWETFNIPRRHKKGKPFVDHVFSFSIVDDKVWFRHFQILHEKDGKEEQNLVEIGPRFVLEIVKIFNGAMGGATVYVNDSVTFPETIRRNQKVAKALTYKKRKFDKDERMKRSDEVVPIPDEVEEVFRE